MLACAFIFSNSTAVNRPGLFRMYSGIASFPMSCSSEAASMAWICGSSLTPKCLARPDSVFLHSPDMPVRDLILCVNRHRQRFDCREIKTIQLV